MSDAIPTSPSGIAGAFTRKLGPLPGWAWILIIVAIAYAVYYARKQSTTKAADPDPTVDPWASQSADYSDLPKPVTTGGTITPTGNVGNVSTNAQWARMVVNDLIAQGYPEANNAISAYLNGDTLTTSQAATVATALAKYGTPPEGIIPTNTTPAGPSSAPIWRQWQGNGRIYAIWDPEGKYAEVTLPQYQAAGSPSLIQATKDQITKYGTRQEIPWPGGGANTGGDESGHTYTVRRGDTLQKLAYRFYGDQAQWLRIAQANQLTGDTIHRGLVLTIPN